VVYIHKLPFESPPTRVRPAAENGMLYTP